MGNNDPENNDLKLSDAVYTAIEDYFRHLNGDSRHCDNLYALVMSEVERPLLKCVMEHCNNNRTQAARALGINRATLRKKLEQYGLG
ncbi:MAG TPA: Fis family transcriptional regulator [Gammaproteobacteria bacterium]|nr:Fis family transcriptional regulator [Gammaproteobacteria bacterium]